MSELSNALQGKLNSRKSHVKDPGSDRQLDLFTSLSDRSVTKPKFAKSKTEPEPREEIPLVLPVSEPSTDLSADVRSVLSEASQVRHVEATPVSAGESPLIRTGVYHRPRRVAAPPSQEEQQGSIAPSPKRAFSIAPLIQSVRGWFSGIELDRRMLAIVAALFVVVALVAIWSVRPARSDEEVVAAANPDKVLPVEEIPPVEPMPMPVTPAPVAAVAAAPTPAAPAPVTEMPVVNWKIPGTVATQNGGAILLRFEDPVFVSADNISIEGMRALKAVAAKLVAMKISGRVLVTGYTDDVPLTKPTAQFKSNDDIAAARGKVAADHLAQFARANKGLVFEAKAGSVSQAPYPNDSPQNRRLNRTATVQVIPAP